MVSKLHASLWALSLLTIGAASVAACRQISGVEDLAFQEASGTGATESGSGSGGGGGSVDAGCPSITYPPPPQEGDPGGEIDFTIAMRAIDLGDMPEKASPVGLDLDNFCTCQDEGVSCVAPAYATADHCDDLGGVDNAASRFFTSMTAALGTNKIGSGFYSAGAEAGSWTRLIRVSGFNGTLNDPKVRLAIYMPAGLQSSVKDPNGGDKAPCMSGAEPPEQQPCWNGADIWRVSDVSITSGGTIDMPVYVDDNAYVSGGVVVANVSDTSLTFASGDSSFLDIRLTAATIMGKVEKPLTDDAGWRITSGTLTGRWRMVDLFQSLSTFSAEGNTLCTDDPIYGLFKGKICEFVDISSKLGGATLECDSMSFGMEFSTFPVKLGPVVAAPVPISQCPPESDPALDGCGK